MGNKTLKHFFFFFSQITRKQIICQSELLTIGVAPGENREQGTLGHMPADTSIHTAETVPKRWRGTSAVPVLGEEEEEHRGVTDAVSLTLLVGKILGMLQTKCWLSWPWRQASFSFTPFLSTVEVEDPISDKPTERVLHKLPGPASSFLQLLSRKVQSAHISPDPSSPTSTRWSLAAASPGLTPKVPQ